MYTPLKNAVRRFTLATSFLTIFPVPKTITQTVSSDDFAGSFSFFPAVGLLLGICSLCSALLIHAWMPALLASVALTALLILLTRGLHFDGLADLADGIGGGYTSERRLAIMKDSSIGTFGSLALTLAVLCKVASIQVLLKEACWASFLLVPVFSRLTMVFAAYKSIYARPDGGLGKPFLEHMTVRQPLAAAISGGIIALMIAPQMILLYFLTMLLCAALFRWIGRRWLGGMTGDVLGAANEVTEIVLLSISACSVSQL